MPGSEQRIERESLFARMVSAYMRRDFAALERVMRPDVELELVGSSPLSGVHRGYEAFGRYVVSLRDVLRSGEKPIAYVHDEHRMIARHDIVVHGADRQVEMALNITIEFDTDGKVGSIRVEPEDPAIFDSTLRAALGDTGAS